MLAAMRPLVLVPLVVMGLFVGGCGVAQAPECERYVACQAAYDAAFGIEPPTDTADYDEGGACWFGNLETAATCAATCENATAALSRASSAGGQPLDACEG